MDKKEKREIGAINCLKCGAMDAVPVLTTMPSKKENLIIKKASDSIGECRACGTKGTSE